MGWVRVGILAVLLAVGGGEEDGGGSNDLQQSPGTALSREAARLYEEGVELCRRGGNAEACRAKMASSLHFDRNQVHPLGREIRTWASVCFQCARCRLPPPPTSRPVPAGIRVPHLWTRFARTAELRRRRTGHVECPEHSAQAFHAPRWRPRRPFHSSFPSVTGASARSRHTARCGVALGRTPARRARWPNRRCLRQAS